MTLIYSTKELVQKPASSRYFNFDVYVFTFSFISATFSIPSFLNISLTNNHTSFSSRYMFLWSHYIFFQCKISLCIFSFPFFFSFLFIYILSFFQLYVIHTQLCTTYCILYCTFTFISSSNIVVSCTI